MSRRLALLLAVVAAVALVVAAVAGGAAKPPRLVVEKAPVLPARATDNEGKQVTVRDVSSASSR